MPKFKKALLILFLISITIILSSQNTDTTDDKYKKRISALFSNDFNPKEDLKEPKFLFNAGVILQANSRVLFKYFTKTLYGIEPIPNNKWMTGSSCNVWGKFIFGQGKYIFLNLQTALLMERINVDERELNALIPLFNIENFLFHWDYKIAKVIIGRTNYSLKSSLIFSGPLDGLGLYIDVPHLSFKTFIGFTGLLGLFNPRFNPYHVTSLDVSYEEQSNLIYFSTIIKFNDTQARRIFFGTDFDIQLFNQHINPYFLIQIDLSSLYFNLSRDYEVNTYHIGINHEGRIIKGFYYKVNFVTLFGTCPKSEKNQFAPIISYALESSLRYTISEAKNLTFITSYAFGAGNDEKNKEWSNSDDIKNSFWSDKFDAGINNKFFYFGKFDGGFVLNPILSNIHSASFKILFTPINKITQLTLYTAYYQTFKIWSQAPISDDECNLNSYFVGSEIDMGLIINSGNYLTFSFDTGIFIPQLAYKDKTPKFKGGLSITLSF